MTTLNFFLLNFQLNCPASQINFIYDLLRRDHERITSFTVKYPIKLQSVFLAYTSKLLTIDFWKVEIFPIDGWRRQNFIWPVRQMNWVLLIVIIATNTVVVHAFIVMIGFFTHRRLRYFWIWICIGIWRVQLGWCIIWMFTVCCAVNGRFRIWSWMLWFGNGTSKVFNLMSGRAARRPWIIFLRCLRSG